MPTVHNASSSNSDGVAAGHLRMSEGMTKGSSAAMDIGAFSIQLQDGHSDLCSSSILVRVNVDDRSNGLIVRSRGGRKVTRPTMRKDEVSITAKFADMKIQFMYPSRNVGGSAYRCASWLVAEKGHDTGSLSTRPTVDH